MKKSLIGVVIALLVLNAFAVFANVSPYTNARSLTRMGSVDRVAKLSPVAGCDTDIMADPDDVYFVGKARKECIESNKQNMMCQQRCFDQVRLMLRGVSVGRLKPAAERYGCKMIDPVMLGTTNTASSCYFSATGMCSGANPSNDYCRRKCLQQLYTTCRRNIMTTLRYS